MKVVYRAWDPEEESKVKKQVRKVPLHKNRAYMEALKAEIVRRHNEKIKARK